MKLDLDAIEAAAREATPGPCQSAYTHPRDDNNWAANFRLTRIADADTVLLMCKAIRAAQEVMALYHDGPLPTSIRALREALAPFDAQPEASTTGAKGAQQHE